MLPLQNAHLTLEADSSWTDIFKVGGKRLQGLNRQHSIKSKFYSSTYLSQLLTEWRHLLHHLGQVTNCDLERKLNEIFVWGIHFKHEKQSSEDQEKTT